MDPQLLLMLQDSMKVMSTSMLLYTLAPMVVTNEMLSGARNMKGRDSTYVTNAAFRYFGHTTNDIRNIGWGTSGLVRLYHGAPEEYAVLMVKHGGRLTWSVENLAKEVASLYKLNWIQFKTWTNRISEIISKVSTSTAPVAVRWSYFELGEILSMLNADARHLVEANRRKKFPVNRGKDVRDIYDEMWEEAHTISEVRNLKFDRDLIGNILNLPNKLKLSGKGALVEVMVDIRGIPEIIKLQARQAIEDIGDEYKGYVTSPSDVSITWNDNYRDIRVPRSSIKSARIVMVNIEQDKDKKTLGDSITG